MGWPLAAPFAFPPRKDLLRSRVIRVCLCFETTYCRATGHDRAIKSVDLMEVTLFRAILHSDINCITSVEEQWACPPALKNSKLDRNFFKFGFGCHSCRTISLGTESNLGHYASKAKSKKIGRFRPIDFLCLQIGYSDPAGGH